ncbi:neuron navigator 2-like [Lampris incognitus]|uniref:neuron navigator 2-like n=1 Tax=Lampris incognitus TaxID=2546036 RepID=UPI0024B610E7|nr:neuron navigator 2-like [Lampris incognitus]
MESMCESGVSAEMLPPSASKQTGDPDLVSPTTRSRHGHLSPLRGDEHRDWLRSHTVGGVQESGASSPFSPCSSLTSPSGTRFALSSQLGSPTAANQMSLSALRSGGVPAGQSNQEAGNCDGFKTSNMSLDEKSRTVSTSGSIKDGVEEVNGSSLSLVSSTSSVYSTSEEKSQSEIRKLRRELEASQEKVSALTNQLNANAHLVAAFEQSLSNMTVRLQNLTSNAEQKDSELNELRRTIEQLKKQNNEAQAAINTVMNTTEPSTPGECVVSEQGSPLGGPSERSEASIVRQPSTESVTSLTNSHTSLSSLGSSNNDLQNHTINSKKKKKNWLRSSFKEAFGKRRSSKSASSHSDMDDSSQPSSPNLSSNHKNHQTGAGLKSSHSSSLISECAPVAEAGAVMQLRSELRDKEMKLTDIRLEALSSAHQLDTLREAMTRMQNEMETLRRENMRLKTETQNHHNHNQPQSHQDQIHTHNQYPTHSNHEQHLIHNNHNSKPWQNQSQQENHNQQPPQAKSQQNSCHIREGAGRGYPPTLGRTQSNSLDITESASLDMLLLDSAESIRKEGRHVKVVVSLKHHDTKATQEDGKKQFLIGCIRVSGRTKWDILDGVVRRLFKEYLLHVDAVGQLGLSSDSVLGYSIADIHLRPGLQIPELLPCGYLVGDSDTISVYLKDPSFLCADSLVFGTLVPLPIMQQYISQLQKHRSLILSGAGGLGKGFLALQLAEHIVQSERQEVKPGVITTFSFDKNNSQELQQFLCKLWDQFECRNSWPVETNLPLVVIVENLHHIPAAHAHLFKRLFNSSQHHCPYVIGTTSQNSFSLDLHLHHSHSLMLLCNKEEPVKGFLARCLRRQLLEAELSSRCQNPEMAKIVDWLPAVWRHLNHFLELHGSTNASIGPGPFLSCPMAADASRLWFIDLWNYSLIPYCIEAGKQLHGSKVEWKDPADWVIDSWPWSSSPAHQDLLCLQPEDFGFSGLSKICSQAGQMAQDKDAVVSML